MRARARVCMCVCVRVCGCVNMDVARVSNSKCCRYMWVRVDKCLTHTWE